MSPINPAPVTGSQSIIFQEAQVKRGGGLLGWDFTPLGGYTLHMQSQAKGNLATPVQPKHRFLDCLKSTKTLKDAEPASPTTPGMQELPTQPLTRPQRYFSLI